MGIDVFEEVVASWLQTNGYFMMNNIKYGHNQEIDILATKTASNKIIHIEVTCSSNPVSIIGTKKAGEKDYEQYAIKELNKKFFNEQVIDKIKEVTNQDVEIKRWFIHAKLKEPRQLDTIKSKDIKTIHIKTIIKEIIKSRLNKFSGDKRLKQLFDIMQEENVE
tara:strand:- start:338 stop:829 length:492 start_codon:yes stop_codon:yes gene_type:complete